MLEARFETGYYENQTDDDGIVLGEDGIVRVVVGGTRTTLPQAGGGGGGIELLRVDVAYTDISVGAPGDSMTTPPLTVMNEGDVLLQAGVVVLVPFDDTFGGSFQVMDGSQARALTGSVNYSDPVVSSGGLLLFNGAASAPRSVVAVGDGVNLLLVTDGYDADGTEGLASVFFVVARAT